MDVRSWCIPLVFLPCAVIIISIIIYFILFFYDNEAKRKYPNDSTVHCRSILGPFFLTSLLQLIEVFEDFSQVWNVWTLVWTLTRPLKNADVGHCPVPWSSFDQALAVLHGLQCCAEVWWVDGDKAPKDFSSWITPQRRSLSPFWSLFLLMINEITCPETWQLFVVALSLKYHCFVLHPHHHPELQFRSTRDLHQNGAAQLEAAMFLWSINFLRGSTCFPVVACRLYGAAASLRVFKSTNKL